MRKEIKLGTTGAGVSWAVLTASEAVVGVSTLVASEDCVEDWAV